MPEKENKNSHEDLLANISEVMVDDVPPGVDRRTFMMRGAVVAATAVITGRTISAQEKTARATAPPPPLDPDLNVVQKGKGPVMTTLDEFYKVGPGPSSSHTIGPMRITYDFYQRATKLPPEKLAKATALKVHLFGSLSATGKGHGTERAALAAKNRRRLIHCFSTAFGTSPIRCSR
jgi:L-serine dehydratase